MKMRIGLNDSRHVARLSQMTQKTNQFNLTTRKYDEHQMQEFIRSGEWLVAHFSLADVFGDSGIVGLALFRALNPEQAELDTFLMSCRVIGREAESAFLHAVLRRLADQGVTEVVADYMPPRRTLWSRTSCQTRASRSPKTGDIDGTFVRSLPSPNPLFR